MKIKELPSKLQDLVAEELTSDEKVVWLSQPVPFKFIFWRSVFSIAAGLFWMIFCLNLFHDISIFGTTEIGQTTKPSLVNLFSIPFYLLGFMFLILPFYLLYQAKRTVYVLTDFRAIVFNQQFLSLQVNTYDSSSLSSLRRKQKNDGSGDLIFEQKLNGIDDNHRTDFGFLAIENVKKIEEKVRNVFERKNN